MAPTEQPLYGTPHRPQYQHQQPSYASTQRSYAPEYSFDPREQNANSYSRPQPRVSQDYGDPHEPTGGRFAHDQSHWQGGNENGFNGNRRNGGGGQNGDQGLPVQQALGRPIEAAHRYNEPRPQGQQRSKSRPPERSRNQEAREPYNVGVYYGSQDHHQHDQLEQRFYDGSVEQSSVNYEPDHSSQNYHNGWRTGQQHGASSRGGQGHATSQQGTGFQEKAYTEEADPRTIQDYRPNASVFPTHKYQERSRPTHRQPPSTSSRSETSQRSKASSSKMINPPISPDTVSWDNPFPTFPMRPKKGAHSSSKSLDGSSAAPSLSNERRYDANHNNRPGTASSKSSSYTIPDPQVVDEPTSIPQTHEDKYSNRMAGAQKQGYQPSTTAHDQPKTRGSDRSGDRVNQLKRPNTTQSRNSEDNRARPQIPNDLAIGSNYERSRTMPTSTSEAVTKPRNQPAPKVQANWQEPIAGYYGPDDRGFTPTSPTSHSQLESYGQTRRQPGEERHYGRAVNQVPVARQPHTPQDSLGDVLDNYYDDAPQQDDRIDTRRHPPPQDDEMPNFDAIADPGASHRRGLTIDKHLEPQRKPREYPPGPHFEQPSPHYGGSYAVEPIPRSRSQPDLNNRRSPSQHATDGFNFEIPESMTRPPATAPSHSTSDNTAINFSTPQSMRGPENGGQHPERAGPPGLMPASRYGNTEWNPPSPRVEPSPAAYSTNGRSDRFRSPPQDGRAYGPPTMVNHDFARPDRIRSPPSQGDPRGRGPVNPPGVRSYSGVRDAGNALPPISQQLNPRSPPLQGSYPHDGQPKTLSSRPSPNNWTGPTSAPNVPSSNPDALPSHPTPVRAGLVEGSLVNQAIKPAPIRQYNNTPSPMQLSDPSQRPGSSRSAEDKQDSAPVTHQELDKLKQATAKNPNDMALQLLMAKKMVEAALVLVDARADSRTRSKGREKYILDAYKIVKKLSGIGYNEATFYLADCCTRGSLGLEIDTREAFKLYQTAAKAGHAQAAYRVAVCCEIGQEEGGGTSRDPVKAMQWYKRAATLGDTPAMYKMGIISLKGLLGQPKNPKEAIVWLKRAAERADKENPHALHELALLHEKPNGNDGVNKDEAYSMQLFAQAANLGYKFSQYRLGTAYEYGLMGCPVDPRQSIAWYSKAAVQEEHQSELALGGWYLTGSEGVLQQSDTEAYLWSRKAAQAGLAKAEYAMGYFTEVGIGAPANLEDAKRWYWRAASQNFPKARERLEELRKGGPTKRKERVSRSNMRKSTEGECTIM